MGLEEFLARSIKRERASMRPTQEFLARWAMCGALGAALAMSSGCNRTRTAAANSEAGERSGSGPAKFSPTHASVCLQQAIKNPKGPFHLSFAQSSSDGKSTSIEADVTRETIDYTKRETSAGQTSTSSKKIERARLSEMELDFDIMGPVPWHGELVAAEDSAKAAGVEDVDGYRALKYAIDTANEPAAERATFDSLMAVEAYKITGAAWVTADTGCLVKYAIDFEQQGKDGSVKKAHFEGTVTKE